MWKYLYTIYDSVMKEHSAPFMANNDNHALAIFDHAISQATKSGYKSDFELYKICEFNVLTGEPRTAQHKRIDVPPADPQQDLFEEET